jgi:RecB family exonuclease
VITPRRTRLVRVPDLHAFRRAIAACSTEGAPDLIRSTAVLVPTRAAASIAASVVAAPPFVTRDELYQTFHARLAEPLRFLTACEREVILRTAAAGAIADGAQPPFHLRPGLVAEMMRFYDQLRRQGQSVDRYEELLVATLDAESDRGAERLLRQTRFLAASYRRYEGRLAALGHVDEHALRGHLMRTTAADPLRRVVVTVGDWIADAHGLFTADFDLLARVPGLEQIDVVATDGLLRSGFHQRLHDWLPGLDEIDGNDLGVRASPVPRILAPRQPPGALVWVSRDREEELIAVARRVAGAPDRTAVVFERPLPYLYLAREVFGSAGIPYRTLDTLPLAVEPVAAALDLVIEFVSSQFTRDASVALLRSPHFLLGEGGEPLSRSAIAGLDRVMREHRYLGEIEALRALEADVAGNADVHAAWMAVARAAETLQPLTAPAPASSQLSTLASFLQSHATRDSDERAARGRAALVNVLQSLAAARASHGDPGDNVASIDDLAPDIRRWIEEETFDPRSGQSGLLLLDAQAARFGDFDTVSIVGLIEGEWPERPRRNIFYSPGVLAALGWPSERDRRSAATAAFLDLVRSPSRQIIASTFTFDDEALVEPSSLTEELAGVGLSAIDEAEGDDARLPARRVFVDEALSIDPVQLDTLGADVREWAVMRAERSGGNDARYHGAAGRQAPRAWSVSAIETYLTCPFKFFAQYVLRLDEEEERADQEVMDPKAQGRFVHEVFEAFFSKWQSLGHRAITVTNLHLARHLFEEIVEEGLRPLPEAEAALERTRLLGSPVAAGLGEVVFRMEAERQTGVVERLLEYRLSGEFEFIGPRGTRRMALKGVADRLDLLEDGTFRLIDYKLSSAPTRSRALQLPIYGLCAEQRLQQHHGRRWTLGEAAYIAFRGTKRVTPLFTRRADRDEVLASAQEKLIDAVDGIERGDFPPTPDDVFLCGFCSYAAVCRKDYVGDV